MKNWIWAVALGSLILSGCGGSRTRLKVGMTPEGEVVQAEGSCPIVGDMAGVKACALAAAQRSAVERVVGVFVSGRTRVEKAIAIEQNILAKSEGYVKKYDIVKEAPTKDKFYKTTILALIAPQEVEADLRNLVKSSVVGNPRVAVMLDEIVDGDVTDRLSATQALTEALLNKGFRVVDREALAQANAMAQMKAIEDGDPSKIANLAKSLKAELLLVGSAHASFNTDKGLGGLVSYRGTVSVQAVKAATGEIVKTASRTQSAVEVNKDLAADKARGGAAKQVADAVVADLAKALAKTAGLELTLKGVSSLSQLADIQKAVSSVTGVEDIYTRSYDSDMAVMDMSLKETDTNAVAQALEKMSSVSIRVEEIMKDRLTASVSAR